MASKREEGAARKIMGRAPQKFGGTTWRTVMVPEPLYSKIGRCAFEQGVSLALYVRRILEGALPPEKP